MSTENTVYERKIIMEPNLGVFVQQVADLAADGWTIDPKQPAGQFGFYFEAHLLKDEKLIDKSPTRADITANARSAKKVKAEAKAAEVEAAPEAP